MSSNGPIRSVLLMQAGALGDTVLQLRIAEAVRQALPAARIAWLGRDGWLPLVRRCPVVDEALGADAWGVHRLFEAGTETDRDAAEFLGRFDLILNGMAADDSPVMDRVRRFARRAAITCETRPGPGLARHVCRQWLDQIAAPLAREAPAAAAHLHARAASLDEPQAAILRPASGDLSRAAGLLGSLGIDRSHGGSGPVLVHPGSGGAHKCWPIERYLRLVSLLSQRDARPVALVGPAELERWPRQVDALRRAAPTVLDPPLPLLAALASLADAYVGNDAGPSHVAAAVGAPCLVLFGPTDPRIWRPLGPYVNVLRSRDSAPAWGDLPAEHVMERLVARGRRR